MRLVVKCLRLHFKIFNYMSITTRKTVQVVFDCLLVNQKLKTVGSNIYPPKKQSCPATRHTGAWRERRYSSYTFLTSALYGGEWSASRPGRALHRGMDPPVPIVQEGGWASEPVWTQRLEEKSFSPAAIEPPSPRRPVRSQTLY
jgi:hypothetical protein